MLKQSRALLNITLEPASVVSRADMAGLADVAFARF